MPPERVCHFDARKTGGADHLGESAGLRKFADRLDEILVGFGVAGHGAAERRNYLERKQIVEPIEAGNVDGGEFQAQEAAAGLQHAIGFAEREVDPRHVADAERDGVGVEAAIRECQRLGIAFDERHLVVEVLRGGAVRGRPRACRGLMSQTVALKAGARGLGGAKGDIAGAACDVEQRERRIAASAG